MGSVVGPLWILEDGYSMQFDGTDDYIDCGNMPEMNGLTQATWSCWFKRVTSTAGKWLMGTFGGGVGATYDQFAIFCGNSSLRIDARDTAHVGGTPTMFSHNLFWNLDYWYHITVVFDGTEAINADKFKVYLDKVQLVNALAPGDDMTDLNTVPSPFLIGKNGNVAATWLGNIDEVAIWDKALTPAEVSALYSNGRPIKLHSPPFNPIAWYRMGDNGVFKYPQWLLPENSNKDKVSNYSMDLDGTDDYIEMGDVLHQSGTTPFSLSAWVKVSTNAGHTVTYPIMNKRKKRSAPTYTTYGYGMYLATSGGQFNKLGWSLIGDTTTGVGNISKIALTLSINDGIWHHVVTTYNGSRAASGVTFYIDGVKKTSTQTLSDSFTGANINDPTVNFKMGKTFSSYGGGRTEWFDGSIDESAIFDIELSQTNISFMYSGGTNGTLPDLSSLNPVGYWKMGDMTYSGGTPTTGTTIPWVIPDSSINDNTGLAENMDIEDRVGDAPSSANNAVSYNMELNSRTTDVPT